MECTNPTKTNVVDPTKLNYSHSREANVIS